MPESQEARLEAEESLLGALLIEGANLNETAIEEVKAIIQSSHFIHYNDGRHARIYEAMTHLKHPHQVAVAEELNQNNKLQKGDCSYMAHLVAECPCPIAYMDFARAILSYSHETRKPKYKEELS